MDNRDARARVLNLYKAWYRHIPFMVKDFDFPKNESQCREVLRLDGKRQQTAEANEQSFINSCFRAEFRKNAGVKDIRVIDMLVIKVKHFYFKRQ